MNKIFVVLLSLLVFSTARAQTVDFTYQSASGLFCTPSAVQFAQKCIGNPTGFIWDFGNGQKAYTASPTITYAAAGTYVVKLIALFSNSTLQISKNVIINPVVKAAVSADRNYICTPGPVNFTGSGNVSIANYQWDFGDGTALVTTTNGAATHSFAVFGVDTVKLRTTAASGCYGDTTIVISIENPSTTVTVTPSRGCVPANVTFTGLSELPANSSVATYSWDFGDGSQPVVTTTNTTSHNYAAVGNYAPRLTVTTTDGCVGRTNIPDVMFGSPPALTTANPVISVICAHDSAYFIAKGTNANRYFWGFGDGISVSTTDTIVSHKYTSLGIKRVGVTAYYNSCPGTYTRTSIQVVGVIAGYTITNSCIDKSTYSFTNTSQGNVSSNSWIFGDGQKLDNTTAAVHAYPATGQFLSSHIVNDAGTGCSDTAYHVINTAVPVLISPALTVCKNDSVSFSISNNYPDTTLAYTWHLLGTDYGPDSNAVIKVKANAPGSYDNYVVINRGPQLCPDTVRSASAFVVKGGNLAFNLPATTCFIDPVVITNSSPLSTATDTVKVWYWNYGSSAQNDSVYQPAAFQYPNPGTYNVTLTAVDSAGCVDTLTKMIDVNPSPFLRMIPQKTTLCAGQSATLVALNNDTVLWSPAIGLSCTNCDTVVAKPAVSTKYYATVTNEFNCSVRDSSFVEINQPFTVPPSSGTASICNNETVMLDATPKGKKILWSPAASLSNATIYNPVARPSQSTVYTAILSDSAGCFNINTTFDVHVRPSPVVDAGPDKFYLKGADFTFAPVYSSNVASYNWSPSALLSCSDCAVPTGVAASTQKYILTVTSDSGCVATDSVIIHTECVSSELYLPKAFSPNNDGLNDIFYPLADGFNTILSFTIFDRNGKIVYAAHNFPPSDRSFGWNGRYKGKDQPPGAYVYAVEAICQVGQRVNVSGNVILIR